MGDLSKNFSREEFKCPDCDFSTVDAELLRVLQEDIRDYYNREVTITSGCRCKVHNKEVGGAEKSEHLNAKAADFKVEGTSAYAVYYYLSNKFKGKYGIGRYGTTRCHIDVRDVEARWEG